MKHKYDIDKLNYFYEEKQARLRRFVSGKEKGFVMLQRVTGGQYEAKSHTKEETLEEQLKLLDLNMQIDSDIAYFYLEPWHGCGVYAAAFGAKIIEYPHTALQTMCCYDDVAQVKNLVMPNYRDCEVLMRVLDTIRYFREQTGDGVPIALTDMQSPNDTASLILEPVELFAASLEDPEAIQPFLWQITQFLGDFVEIQLEALGTAPVAFAGHTHPSDPSFKGVSVSDDNMSFISPASYAVSAKEFNSALGKRFGGIALHSCGVVTHNLAAMMETDGLNMFDCALGYGDKGFLCDPNPNEAGPLRESFTDRDVVLKVRLGPGELERVYPLLTPRIKLIVELITHGSVEEKNAQFATAKTDLEAHYA